MKISETRFRKLKRNQRGTNLVEIVIAMALFFAIGGGFVFAAITIEDARKNSLDQTQTTIGQSGISNSFRSDMGSARALKLNETANGLSVAKSDGSCAYWTIAETPGASTARLLRTTLKDSATTASELDDGIELGSFSLDPQSVGIDLSYGGSNDFSERVRLNIAGTDGGECW